MVSNQAYLTEITLHNRQEEISGTHFYRKFILKLFCVSEVLCVRE